MLSCIVFIPAKQLYNSFNVFKITLTHEHILSFISSLILPADMLLSTLLFKILDKLLVLCNVINKFIKSTKLLFRSNKYKLAKQDAATYNINVRCYF